MKNLSFPLVVFAVLLQLFAYYTLIAKIEPFMYQFYIMVWWSYICLVDGLLGLVTGRRRVVTRRIVYLAVWSVAFWCFFELLNVRLEDWFYINVPPWPAPRFGGYFLAYATVIPAVYATKELIARFLPDIRVSRRGPSAYRVYALPLGLACLAACLAFPSYFFCLAWVFLALVLDGFNYRRGYRSLVRDIEEGSLREVVAAAAAGLACGFLWEMWNYWSITKWVYTVPFFEDGKLFEMPAAGYIGFVLFGLETVAFVNLMDESRIFQRRCFRLSLLALAFSVLTFFLIDRYTVFSYNAPVDDLFFLRDETKATLEARGVEASYAIDPALLDERERKELALMHLKGLGLDNVRKLADNGVFSVEDLSKLDESDLSRILGEPNMRRVRIYLAAARG